MDAFAVYDVAEALRSCARDRLASTTAGPPERSCIVWGAEIPADGCDCGALAVAVTRLFPSSAFPNEAGTTGAGTLAPCGAPYLVAEITVQILRCVAVPDDGEISVPCTTVQAEARTAHEDAHAVRNAVQCCLRDLLAADTISEWLVRDQVPVGPDGGCAGSALRLLVEFIDGCPCDEGGG